MAADAPRWALSDSASVIGNAEAAFDPDGQGSQFPSRLIVTSRFMTLSGIHKWNLRPAGGSQSVDLRLLLHRI
jgi:hypothetical protein